MTPRYNGKPNAPFHYRNRFRRDMDALTYGEPDSSVSGTLAVFRELPGLKAAQDRKADAFRGGARGARVLFGENGTRLRLDTGHAKERHVRPRRFEIHGQRRQGA